MSEFDVRKFVESFPVLAEAEEGTLRLRQFVLGLALSGSLHGSITDPTAEGEMPALPTGWRRVKVGEVAGCVLGKMLDGSKHTKGTKRPYLRNINVRWGACDLSNLLEMFFEEDELDRYSTRPGDVLICEGGEPGRAAVWTSKEPVLIQKAIHRVRPEKDLLPDWLVLNLRHDTWSARLDKYFTGATIKHFTGRSLSAYAIPLPPVAEQARIVAKVDDLMRMLDDLEAKQARKRHVQVRFRKSALEALTQAEGPKELAAAWKRVEGNFDVMIDRSEEVNLLRTAVLALAIQGALDEQWERVSTPERPDLGALPSNWVWRRVDDVGEVKLGKMRSPEHHHGEHMRPYLRVANVLEGRIDTTDVRSMNFPPADAERYELALNDILLNEGQSVELVGRPAIYRGEVPGACFQKTLIRFRCHSFLNPEFALLVFRAYMRTGRFQGASVQTTNMAHLPLMRLVGIEFPLPPIDEQLRVVAMVEQFMRICDELEARLRYQEATASKLVGAVVAKLVA